MLTFVSGHPGRTEREDTTAQLAYERDYALPRMIAWLSEYRGMLGEFQTRGAEQARISNTALFGVENSLKAYKGRQEALVEQDAFQKKVAEENALRTRIDADAEAEGRVRQRLAGNCGRSPEAARPRHALHLPRAQSRLPVAPLLARHDSGPRRRGAAEAERRAPAAISSIRSFPALKQAHRAATRPSTPSSRSRPLTFSLTKLREVLGPDDPSVKAVLGPKSPREIATDAVKGTKLGDPAVSARACSRAGKAAIDGSSDSDDRCSPSRSTRIARAIRKQYEDEVESVLKKNGELLGRARFAAYGNPSTPTPRSRCGSSYGTVKGWEENGRKIAPLTDARRRFRARHAAGTRSRCRKAGSTPRAS